MIMGVIGILIAMVINMFLQSSGLNLAIWFLGVLIFAGLTAYDTQRLKRQYYHVAGTDFAGKAVVLGALTLYLDFINMFQFLLRFLGNRELRFKQVTIVPGAQSSRRAFSFAGTGYRSRRIRREWIECVSGIQDVGRFGSGGPAAALAACSAASSAAAAAASAAAAIS